MKKIIIKLIKFYKKAISPFWAGSPFGSFNSSCRFYPTCSDYAIDAISKYGAGKGTLKAVGRVLRCNPLAKAGIDEVPIAPMAEPSRVHDIIGTKQSRILDRVGT